VAGSRPPQRLQAAISESATIAYEGGFDYEVSSDSEGG